MDKFFSLFGKLTLIVILLGGVAYGAYTFGKTSLKPGVIPGAASTTAAPTTSTDPGLRPESLPEGFVPRKIILAGLGPESGLSFTQYQISVPEDWQVIQTSAEGRSRDDQHTQVDTLTLTKNFGPTGGKVQLKIFQAATGGALCLYPGDADFEGPSSRYDTFADIKTVDDYTLRRGTTNNKDFTVCQMDIEGTFGQPTKFGHMSLTNVVGTAAFTEVDTMIASLKKR